MISRKPAVAGYFYPSNQKELLRELEEYMPSKGNLNVIGAICPHAGYIYSGSVAGLVYSKIKPKNIYVLLGPNHTGYGPSISIMNEGQWELPIGKLEIHKELANSIISNFSKAEEDFQAHLYEHSLEVQLPFIYKLNKEAKIVPIILKMIDFKDALQLATALASSLKELQIADDTIIIASTDMSHYLPDRLARKVDSSVIEKIKNFDPEGLYNIVLSNQISMCGFIPTVTMLLASKMLGAKEVQIIKYATSAEVSRDYERVVGYLGAVVL